MVVIGAAGLFFVAQKIAVLVVDITVAHRAEAVRRCEGHGFHLDPDAVGI